MIGRNVTRVRIIVNGYKYGENPTVMQLVNSLSIQGLEVLRDVYGNYALEFTWQVEESSLLEIQFDIPHTRLTVDVLWNKILAVLEPIAEQLGWTEMIGDVGHLVYQKYTDLPNWTRS